MILVNKSLFSFNEYYDVKQCIQIRICLWLTKQQKDYKLFNYTINCFQFIVLFSFYHFIILIHNTAYINNIYYGNNNYLFQDRRGSLSVETDRSLNYFASRLTLASVTRSDSGKYTCKSGNKNSTTFTLHVISPGKRTEYN